MDATVNELEDVNISSYPTIKLYKRDTNEVPYFFFIYRNFKLHYNYILIFQLKPSALTF